MKRMTGIAAAAGIALLAGSALAQPTITSLGSGTPQGVSNLAGGNYYVSGSGIVTSSIGRWTFNPAASSVTAAELGGAGNAYMGISSDGAYQLGIFPNVSPQVVGNTAASVSPAFSLTPTLVPGTTPAATETIINRWSSASNTWTRLAMFGNETRLCYGQSAGGVGMMTFGPGSSSGGTFFEGNAISQNGRFVAGHGYISSYNSATGNTIAASTSRWHPTIWDASTNTTTVLPTAARTSSNTYRPRTGRAFAVSNDGLVVVGYQEHNVAATATPDPDGARPLVWRWNAGTSKYDMSYLPTGTPQLANLSGVYYVCCNGTTCSTVTTPSLCTGTVVYGGNGFMACTTTPAPCSQATYACCNGDTCTVVAAGSCTGTTSYVGATSTCTPSPCRQVFTASATAGTIFINAAGTIIVGRNIDDSGSGYICKWTWDSGTSIWTANKLGTNIGANWAVDTISCPAGVPHVTTLTPHGLNVGDKVYLNGNTTIAYNGMWKVTAITTTTFDISGPDDSPKACAADGTGGTVWKAASWLPAAVYFGCGPSSNFGATPALSVTGMSDDGNTVVGTATYQTCGSFQQGGFVWHTSDGIIQDWYDYCVAQNVPAVGTGTFYGPIGDNSDPTKGMPRLGTPTGISPSGNAIVGKQGGNTLIIPSAGPWILVNSGGSTCVAPQITTQPAATISYSLCSSLGVILNIAASGTAPLSYQWYKDSGSGPVAISDGATGNGSSITGSTTVQFRLTNPRATDAGNYTCIITGCNGQTVTTSAAALTPDSTQVTPANNDCAFAVNTGEATVNWNICAAWANQGSACVTDLASVWYRYIPTFTGNARFQTCASTFDTTIQLYDQCNGSQLASGCNDDVGVRGLAGIGASCSSSRSVISSFAVTSGVPIYVRVGAKTFPFSTTSSATSGALTISQTPAAPANDLCDHATVVSGNSTTAFNLNEATDDFNLGVSADGSTSYCTPGASQTATSSNRDVWFRLNAPCGGTYTISTCGSTDTNPMLHVFDGCDSLNLLACNDNVGSGVTNCTSQQARIQNLTITGSVLIRVSQSGTGSPGTAATSGSGNLIISGTDVPCGVCCRGATCNASITSAGACTVTPGSNAGAFFAPVAGAPVCNAGGNAAAPCCYPDYDKMGGTQVADIFAYLNDWFAGSPYAQVGGDGTTNALAVSDIFAFLNAWFAGC